MTSSALALTIADPIADRLDCTQDGYPLSSPDVVNAHSECIKARCPPPKGRSSSTMAELVSTLNDLVRRVPPEGLGALKEDLLEVLRGADLPEHEWAPFAHFNSEVPYTRNLVATDNKSYCLLMLCWNPGYASRIHDHPGDGCYVKVMRNSLEETRYILGPDGEVVPYQTLGAGPGDVLYMHDRMGLHRITNPNLTEGAVSMHLYTPPIQTCKVWNDTGVCDPTTATMALHSVRGVVLGRARESPPCVASLRSGPLLLQ